MSLDKYMSILIVAANKTEEGRLKWEEGPFSDSYICNIASNAISLRLAREDYYLQIFNGEGNVVESISDEDFKISGYPQAYEAMKNLFGMARRNALGADKITIDILDSLNKI